MLMTILYSALVIFGVGLVIFVHELGHFLAARAVGIRVEAFSIGFGTKIWGFKRGQTEYKVCLIPLGGYVKMAGEDPTHPTTGADDEFGSKKVWQRILVISAGVIMNMVFAVVALPIAFSVGVPFMSPVAGLIVEGSPAWHVGIREGDRLTTINGDRVLSFEDIGLEVAVSDGPLDLTYDRDGVEHSVTVTPKEGGRGFPTIGVGRKLKPEFLVSDEILETEDKEGKPLRRAQALRGADLKSGDVILGINRIPATHAEQWDSEVLRVGESPLTLLVRRAGSFLDISVPPVMTEVKESAEWRIGITSNPAGSAPISAVARGRMAELIGLRPGDRITEVDGKPVGDADQLASLLGAGQDPRRTATSIPLADPPPWSPVLRLTVESSDGKPRTLEKTLATRLERARLLDSFILKSSASTRVKVAENTPAARAGLRDGDAIIKIDQDPTDSFLDIQKAVIASEGAPLEIVVRRDGQEVALQGVRAEKNSIFQNTVLEGVLPRLGFEAIVWESVQVPFPDSIGVGFTYAGRMLKRVVKTLKSILRGSVSAKHLGGPITIFTVSYKYTQVGFMRGLLFLAVISINLAILNILPIPVLDGGWLMFLIIEKIKGSPVSERAMGYFQWAGLAFILGLMAFVTWNDIGRLFS